MIEERITMLIGHRADCERSQQAAVAIREKFTQFGQQKLTIVLGSDEKAGPSWPDRIVKRISDAHPTILLLICIGPNGCWDGVLYEYGAFQAATLKESTRLLLLHAPCVEPNRLLAEYPGCTSYEATNEGVSELLRTFFSNVEFSASAEPINEHFARDDESVATAAKGIAKFFDQEVEDCQGPPTIFGDYVVLRIEEPDRVEDAAIPDSAIVVRSRSLEMFGRQQTKSDGSNWTWKELIEKFDGPEHEGWIPSLGRAITSARVGDIVEPIKDSFYSPITGNTYVPVLYARSIGTRGSMEFHISFVAQQAKGLFVAPDDRYSTLMSSLTLGHRLHWEVCNHYIHELTSSTSDIDVLRICKEVSALMTDIDREAEFRKYTEYHGPGIHERLLEAFDLQDKARRAEVDKNFSDQRKCKRKLNALIGKGATSRPEDIVAVLIELQEMNNRLMVLSSQRHQELLSGSTAAQVS